MSDSVPRHYQNQLLQRLSAPDLALIDPYLEHVALPLRTPLETANSIIENVYFIEEGIASIVATIPKGGDTEIGLIGSEGMTGVMLILGDDHCVHDTYMQLAGSGFRVPAAALVEALAASASLKTFLLRYVATLFIQTGFTALVNARSKLNERLARWLLMCHDRAPNDHFYITHEFMAVMLGVRRPGVTVAIQELEGKGLIRATRGEIVIRDRNGLVRVADGTYSPAEDEYERLIGKMNYRYSSQPE
ncbi:MULTISPECIES: Crp/Fnr family transcriptional regulator [unclassified Mesorhizobium]|uniref:Crp/Fnr family transcriptional regulator n=1 Tax=unclassified Mesorhizobium TaxID=325217 RepID=UPI00112B0770|nr:MULTISPECIES: Crp/Fnr family transcriptional regulator [unclassified Mesorhizobium]MBZ9739736.1 Crp/Fnr family transcriptional regulator [Mesorhizobium sp. CO1-1-4]MBZ9805000.1 Crp/Fnr family transcriptional regulator [Mesorhizobium sp. ES1-6]TPL88741.1 Crp/Fnr family transcriptional regulator [Mesorhizobium sp. B2-3-12]